MRGKLGVRVVADEDAGFIPAHAGKTVVRVKIVRRLGVHPRACGENGFLGIHSPSRVGSSPRMRGKRLRQVLLERAMGFIPAHAGKTTPEAPRPRAPRVHPRACGENTDLSAWAVSFMGSSPRMRGKHTRQVPSRCDARFIPAHAGKTGRRSRRTGARTVHPRACGENAHASRTAAKTSGSSPRVRGKHHPNRRGRVGARFIPACAGKTSWWRSSRTSSGVHPRVCGENLVHAQGPGLEGGSSPRVRGKPGTRPRDRWACRFIPACAGKTATRLAGTSITSVHPRVCGENVHDMDSLTARVGSSPRVRGKLDLPDLEHNPVRFIPACAGKTRPSSRAGCVVGVHPRVCGENCLMLAGRGWVYGSSPRVRGKRCGASSCPDSQGFIPACAGKTLPITVEDVRRRVHPRVCGENAESRAIAPLAIGSSPRVRGKQAFPGIGADPLPGSSPRVRGKRAEDVDEGFDGRFIPACAGKTTDGEDTGRS